MTRRTNSTATTEKKTTYLIEFQTYAKVLPGDTYTHRGRALRAYARRSLKHPPTILTEPMQRVTLEAIRDMSSKPGWLIVAASVKEHDVSVICTVDADKDLGRVRSAIKAHATKALRAADLSRKGIRLWARGGTTPVELSTRDEAHRAAEALLEDRDQGAHAWAYWL